MQREREKENRSTTAQAEEPKEKAVSLAKRTRRRRRAEAKANEGWRGGLGEKGKKKHEQKEKEENPISDQNLLLLIDPASPLHTLRESRLTDTKIQKETNFIFLGFRAYILLFFLSISSFERK